MNTVWSDHIQGVNTLYLSRKLRFDDCFREQYIRLFGLNRDAALKILEIGCGPGALAAALHRWYPNAQITAIDRDSNFIAFASKTVPGVRFLEGDAAALPFEENSFDVTISNTVSEHIEPTAFYSEQIRVLKPGGICLVLSARRGVVQKAKCLEMTDVEKRYWDGINDTSFETYGIGKYSMTEQELPKAMEEHGFSGVSTGYAVIDLTPDDPKYPPAMAEAMIEAERQSDLEAVCSGKGEGMQAVLDAVNEKYDIRLRLYRSGEKQWDTCTSVTMVIRGRKQAAN